MKGWALPGETRVQGPGPAATCLNSWPPPPVSGALGVIGQRPNVAQRCQAGSSVEWHPTLT